MKMVKVKQTARKSTMAEIKKIMEEKHSSKNYEKSLKSVKKMVKFQKLVDYSFSTSDDDDDKEENTVKNESFKVSSSLWKKKRSPKSVKLRKKRVKRMDFNKKEIENEENFERIDDNPAFSRSDVDDDLFQNDFRNGNEENFERFDDGTTLSRSVVDGDMFPNDENGGICETFDDDPTFNPSDDVDDLYQNDYKNENEGNFERFDDGPTFSRSVVDGDMIPNDENGGICETFDDDPTFNPSDDVDDLYQNNFKNENEENLERFDDDTTSSRSDDALDMFQIINQPESSRKIGHGETDVIDSRNRCYFDDLLVDEEIEEAESKVVKRAIGPPKVEKFVVDGFDRVARRQNRVQSAVTYEEDEETNENEENLEAIKNDPNFYRTDVVNDDDDWWLQNNLKNSMPGPRRQISGVVESVIDVASIVDDLGNLDDEKMNVAEPRAAKRPVARPKVEKFNIDGFVRTALKYKQIHPGINLVSYQDPELRTYFASLLPNGQLHDKGSGLVYKKFRIWMKHVMGLPKGTRSVMVETEIKRIKYKDLYIWRVCRAVEAKRREENVMTAN